MTGLLGTTCSWLCFVLMLLCRVLVKLLDTVEPVLRDHCLERPPVLKDQICLAECPTCQCNWTCHQRPPVLRDQIFMANRVVFQDGFHCSSNGSHTESVKAVKKKLVCCFPLGLLLALEEGELMVWHCRCVCVNCFSTLLFVFWHFVLTYAFLL